MKKPRPRSKRRIAPGGTPVFFVVADASTTAAGLDASAAIFSAAVVAMAALGAAVVGWWWHRRGRDLQLADEDLLLTQSLPGSRGDPGSVGVGTPIDGELATASEPSSGGEELFFFDESGLSRRCPQCDRSFPSVFEICPFDSTMLREIDGTGDPEGLARALPRRYCPQCQRRFELTARYCYHDGTSLRRDRVDRLEAAPALKVCRQCGWESADHLEDICPRDGEPLEVIEPGSLTPVPPAFPFNRCRQCGHLGAADQTTCPVDLTMMLPEFDVRLRALPTAGFGPRRRLCPECGTRFGDHCSHCAFDGAELIDIN